MRAILYVVAAFVGIQLIWIKSINAQTCDDQDSSGIGDGISMIECIEEIGENCGWQATSSSDRHTIGDCMKCSDITEANCGGTNISTDSIGCGWCVACAECKSCFQFDDHQSSCERIVGCTWTNTQVEGHNCHHCGQFTETQCKHSDANTVCHWNWWASLCVRLEKCSDSNYNEDDCLASNGGCGFNGIDDDLCHECDTLSSDEDECKKMYGCGWGWESEYKCKSCTHIETEWACTYDFDWCSWDGGRCVADTAAPTATPTTNAPTATPTTNAPTPVPTKAPITSAPTDAPTPHTHDHAPHTHAPITSAPTNAPTAVPTTNAPTTVPTAVPTTKAPVTSAPTAVPTTGTPTAVPTTNAPITSAPTVHPDGFCTEYNNLEPDCIDNNCDYYNGSCYFCIGHTETDCKTNTLCSWSTDNTIASPFRCSPTFRQNLTEAQECIFIEKMVDNDADVPCDTNALIVYTNWKDDINDEVHVNRRSVELAHLAPTSNAPTNSPTSKSPTSNSPTNSPTSKSPTSNSPTNLPTSNSPTDHPTTNSPTNVPTVDTNNAKHVINTTDIMNVLINASDGILRREDVENNVQTYNNSIHNYGLIFKKNVSKDDVQTIVDKLNEAHNTAPMAVMVVNVVNKSDTHLAHSGTPCDNCAFASLEDGTKGDGNGLLIGLVVAGLVLLVLIAGVVLKKLVISPNGSTGNMSEEKTFLLGNFGDFF